MSSENDIFTLFDHSTRKVIIHIGFCVCVNISAKVLKSVSTDGNNI